jgi:predicted nucleotidyltransferase
MRIRLIRLYSFNRRHNGISFQSWDYQTDPKERKMEIDINTWMKRYLDELKLLFGSRLIFVGLQGSYNRGEATESSDIDGIVILNYATPEDLKAYGTMLDTLPNREKVCGFISGRQELMNWERSDLFQFYHDTTPVFGNIDFLLPLFGKEDIHRAIRIGACNLYHMCGHNMIHEKDAEILKALYKSAAFTVQAVYCDQTGTYIKRKAELIPLLQPEEREILQTGMMIKTQPDRARTEFERLSGLMFNWAAGLIIKYQTG